MASLAAAFLGGAAAEAESLRCTAITALPYVIATQGNYCLTRDLSYKFSGGNAIQINADFVNLNLNGFALDGGSAGPGTTSIGIYAFKRRNITVKGGSIRGFMYGIRIEDDPATDYATGGAHVVERLRLRGNTVKAIRVQGRGCFIRQNHVVDTRGTTFFSDITVIALEARGPGARVLENVVVETAGRGTGSGIAISVIGASPVVAGNFVSNSSVSSQGLTYGIRVAAGTDALVTHNRVVSMGLGLAFDADSSGAYRDNLTSGCTAPFEVGSAQVRDEGNNL